MLLDGLELSIDELLDKYFFSENHHTSCSVIETKYYNNVIEESSIPKLTNTDMKEDGDLKLGVVDSDNSRIEESEDTISSNSCSGYRYTPQQIEEFFASDNGQGEEHTLEDSICRPLIGKQIHKPFFYYCKICPKIENFHLKSNEHHIKFKDPERHKAKLLEMIQGAQMDKDGLDMLL